MVQCVAVCCSVVQRVAACSTRVKLVNPDGLCWQAQGQAFCKEEKSADAHGNCVSAEVVAPKFREGDMCKVAAVHFIAVCCNVLQCVAVCCSVLQCVAACCSVLHAVCCACVKLLRYIRDRFQ